MKNLLILSLILFSSQITLSQEIIDSNSINPTLTIKVIKDNRIDELNNVYKSTYELIGYRVLIYSGNKKQPANQARSTFLRVHPKTKAHLDYEQPNYKVRVGDFRTKLEALKYKKEIIDEFPNCFITKDKIDINELD
ncbi:MAG: SPOR domain-containing protein [Vicingaceae bacterium]